MSYSQAIAQGTSTNLKLWFCFTAKDCDITIKTSHSGWGFNLHPKFQISKIVKEKGFVLRRKEQRLSRNRFKVVTKFLNLLPVHGAALSLTLAAGFMNL